MMKPKISNIAALRTETKENDQRQTISAEDSVYNIKNIPVMESALDVLSIIGKYKEITLRAKGNSIPNAVSVANIITKSILKENSKIHKIKVDSEPIQELGQIQSNIEIILRKI